jgi:hypothetical protein
MARSFLRKVDQYESFLPHRIGEAFAQCDRFEPRRTPFGGDKGSGKLQRISRLERMHAQKPCRVFPDKFCWLELVPRFSGLRQALEGKLGTSPVEGSTPFGTG